MPQSWLHHPALDWGLPRFLTAPLTWEGRGMGLRVGGEAVTVGGRFLPECERGGRRGKEGPLEHLEPPLPARHALLVPRLGRAAQWPSVPLALSLS